MTLIKNLNKVSQLEQVPFLTTPIHHACHLFNIVYCIVMHSTTTQHFIFLGFVQYTKWASASFEHTLNKPVISYHNELTRYLRISDGMDEPSVKSQDCQGRNTDCVVDKIMSA